MAQPGEIQGVRRFAGEISEASLVGIVNGVPPATAAGETASAELMGAAMARKEACGEGA